MELRIDDFDYQLPGELIAQEPSASREMSRLLVVDRGNQSLRHDVFAALPRYLAAGDLLVANRSRVIPARLHARRQTGGQIELLLMRSESADRWRALARPARKMRRGEILHFSESPLRAIPCEPHGEGEWTVAFEGCGDVAAELRRLGELPLPPYIRSPAADPERYQTVYGDRDGSIAAPTAGLHFSPSLLDRLREAEINMAYVTLHVGLGTFRPVTVERVSDHRMHGEWGEVPEEVCCAVNETRSRGSRVVAVGTTTTRLLESAWEDDRIVPFAGETDRFIYPGYPFRVIDALITNFHLPRSTLLMLVSAFAGRDLTMRAYSTAIAERYRFYSFGDAMLIL